MKKIISLAVLIIASLGILQAQTDTMYLHLKGGTIAAFPVKNIDSIVFYTAVDTTPKPLTDIDGNVYRIVTIGSQTWMKDNLRTTKYRNGDTIGTTDPATKSISSEISPKYQWSYDGNESNVDVYGRLYTWHTMSDSRNVCPMGWHVPADSDWVKMFTFLHDSGYVYDGSSPANINYSITKSMAAKSGWSASSGVGNPGNTDYPDYIDKSGFSALPGGYRNVTGDFSSILEDARWWSSTEVGALEGRMYIIYFNDSDLKTYSAHKNAGMYIRCIHD